MYPQRGILYSILKAKQVGKEMFNLSCIQYSLCEDANSFTLSQSASAGDGAKQDTACTDDYVQISGISL